jgi:hypothetical protein
MAERLTLNDPPLIVANKSKAQEERQGTIHEVRLEACQVPLSNMRFW